MLCLPVFASIPLKETKMNDITTLNIRMKRAGRTAWNTFLQSGFFLNGKSGLSVREFMIDSLGYDDCLIEEVVRTIFLNSSPVDDIDAVHVKDGDRMALGSAMPGLVGICMGRDNPYKSFRGGITNYGDETGASAQDITVFMKIFSSLAVETGEDVLARGIEVEVHRIADLFSYQSENVIDDGGFADVSDDDKRRVRITVAFE